jgi:hypothetical protein
VPGLPAIGHVPLRWNLAPPGTLARPGPLLHDKSAPRARKSWRKSSLRIFAGPAVNSANQEAWPDCLAVPPAASELSLGRWQTAGTRLKQP